MLARAEVANPNGRLRPGLFVSATVSLDTVAAPVAVKSAALQSVDGETIVFVQEEAEGELTVFEAREVEAGVSDGANTEITAGLESGVVYVADNSFVLKSELGKGSAEHAH
jgi:cobalt-zinc-cadmium efflux system membrane fusion protein